jgi:glycine dehydrogenase subunit 1
LSLSRAYILNTEDDQRQMLAAIGAASIEELFASIPSALRLHSPLRLPPAMSELELTQHIQRLGSRNLSARQAVCFLGGGSYDHFIPAVVDAIAGRSEYYTAYTPYQAEASQGSLQAFFEYQTLICQLTGMDVSNASLYEGGSSVAEAVLMALNVTGRRGPVVTTDTVHPEYRSVLQTYMTNLLIPIKVLPAPEGCVDLEKLQTQVTDETPCVVVQHPNFFGNLEEVEAIADIAHRHGALLIVSFDPISLGVLRRPGDYGADIAVAEGQCLGTPMGYGGPYLGILACRKEFVRQLPGRLVGETIDRHGQRCWVLTFQTREQHIRREKATSNICTNQGLFALRAAVYLTALGPAGLKETAELCLQKAHYAAARLTSIPGVSLRFRQPFFKEFVLRIPGELESTLLHLRQRGILAGLPLKRWYPDALDSLLVAVTEKRTREEIDLLANSLQECLAKR